MTVAAVRKHHVCRKYADVTAGRQPGGVLLTFRPLASAFSFFFCGIKKKFFPVKLVLLFFRWRILFIYKYGMAWVFLGYTGLSLYLFIWKWIQSMKLDTLVNKPGRPVHMYELDAIPICVPSTTSGPPESPCKINRIKNHLLCDYASIVR